MVFGCWPRTLSNFLVLSSLMVLSRFVETFIYQRNNALVIRTALFVNHHCSHLRRPCYHCGLIVSVFTTYLHTISFILQQNSFVEWKKKYPSTHTFIYTTIHTPREAFIVNYYNNKMGELVPLFYFFLLLFFV